MVRKTYLKNIEKKLHVPKLVPVNIVDMKRSDVLNLINKDDSIFMEIFRRTTKVQTQKIATVESEISTTVEVTVEAIVENTPNVDARRYKLTTKSSSDSSKKKHLTFSKDEVVNTRAVECLSY